MSRPEALGERALVRALRAGDEATAVRLAAADVQSGPAVVRGVPDE